jgi:hypothetical protein
VGNGGTIFRTTSAPAGSFTIPYPQPVAASSPFRWWVLTQDVSTTAGGGSASVGSGDLSKLATGWNYVKVKETTTDYIRCFAQNGDGVLVCGGDNGTLYKSTDYGNTWTDIGTALALNGDIISLRFNDVDGKLGVLYSGGFSLLLSAALNTITTSTNLTANSVTIVQTGTTLYAAAGQNSSGGITSRPCGVGATGRTLSTGVLPGSTLLPGNGWNQLFITAVNKYYVPVVDSTGRSTIIDGVISTVDTLGTVYPGGYVSNFLINNIYYTELYNEVLAIGRGGKCGVTSGYMNSPITLLNTGVTHDIEAAAFVANAWVMLTRRGVLYTTDSATVTNLTASDASITTKPAGNALISIPTQFRLVANDLGLPGYVRICQL